jgi:hypothetical protein
MFLMPPSVLCSFARSRSRPILPFGQPLVLARLAHLVELLEPGDGLPDRREVGEGTAQPAVVDVELPAAGGLLQHGLLGLLLGAHEEHDAPVGGEVAHERVGLAELLEGLLQVDDVDAVALAEDVLLHLRVPALGLVAEVDPGLQQLFMVRPLVLASFPSSFGWPPVASGRPPERSATLPRQPTRAAGTEARNRAC